MVMESEDNVMSVEVTLTLPENVLENAKLFGDATQQEVEDVLTGALELMFPMVEDSPEKISSLQVAALSDAEVLRLAEAKMDEAQNRRLGELQTRGKMDGLSADERYELLALLRIYQIGQLRKSEALVEAVRRGLREPLKP
jgi:hypothetical protein